MRRQCTDAAVAARSVARSDRFEREAEATAKMARATHLLEQSVDIIAAPPSSPPLEIRCLGRFRLFRGSAGQPTRPRSLPLRVARAWYCGDLLPEIGPTEWVVSDRLRLCALASSALGALAEAELGLGRADAACDTARASLDIDEYQDASGRVLIAAYRRAGSHAAAELVRREYEKVSRGLEV